MFHSDSHFLIGHAHLSAGKPCQDYAVSGDSGGKAYAIVSDGCSTGRRTDVGSRIAALATEAAIHSQNPVTADIIRSGQQTAMAGAIALQVVTQRDMLATALCAYITPAGGFIHLQGDGVTALQYRDGRVELRRYDWKHNTPLYLAYVLDDYAGFKSTHCHDFDAALTAECWQYCSGQGFQWRQTLTFNIEQGIVGVTTEIPAATLAELQFIAVFTDGVCQIDNMDWKLAVLDLLAFKTTAGEFAKRRLNRLVKDTQKIGKGPMDDIAYAVIHIEQENP